MLAELVDEEVRRAHELGLEVSLVMVHQRVGKAFHEPDCPKVTFPERTRLLVPRVLNSPTGLYQTRRRAADPGRSCSVSSAA
jgi:hypothetical protein